jgi:hypothetical protein
MSRQPNVTGKVGTLGPLLAAARQRRQAIAGTLHTALRHLEAEPVWRDSADAELVALRASLEAARDELARRVPTRQQQALDAELQRTEGLHAMAERRRGKREAATAAA